MTVRSLISRFLTALAAEPPCPDCGHEAAIERVRTLHRKANNGETCVYCAGMQRIGYITDWPCDTIRALDEPAKDRP